MKSICGSSIFATALVVCLSTIHATADRTSPFDCTAAIEVPPAVVGVCPELNKDVHVPNTNVVVKIWVHAFVARAINDISKRVDENCPIGVEYICEKLPKIVATSVQAGQPQCQDNLKLSVCRGAASYLREDHVVMCPYYESLQIMIGNPDRWKADERTHICPLFQENGILCFMVIRKLCERVTNVLVRNYCQDALEKTICAIFA